MARRPQISVIGPGGSDVAAELLRDAEVVGRGLAEADAALVCGGRMGVMEAASRGAAEAGGTVIGILPTTDPADANPYVTHPIATGIGHARNLAVVASGDAVIAIGGEWGTLTEIAFARRLERQVIALRSWSLDESADLETGITQTETAELAVEAALTAVRK
jgi:uncharacterized protein (TIGR00725 family)